MGGEQSNGLKGALFLLTSQANSAIKDDEIDDVSLVKTVAAEKSLDAHVVEQIKNPQKLFEDYIFVLGKTKNMRNPLPITLLDSSLITIKKDNSKNGTISYSADEICLYYKFIYSVVGKIEEKCGYEKGSSVVIFGNEPDLRSRKELIEKLGLKSVRKLPKISQQQVEKTKYSLAEKIEGILSYFSRTSPQKNTDDDYNPISKTAVAVPKQSVPVQEEFQEFNARLDEKTGYLMLEGNFETPDDVSSLVEIIKQSDNRNLFRIASGKINIDMTNLENANILTLNFFNQLQGLVKNQIERLNVIGYEKFREKIPNLIYSEIDKRYKNKK